MANKTGREKKRVLKSIAIDKLHLDPFNPRLNPELRGKNEKETLRSLKRHFGLDELAFSMSENGYFDEEPLIVIPLNLPEKFEGKDHTESNEDNDYINFLDSKDVKFTVVEGNRRLASVKILISDELRAELGIRKWPQITAQRRYGLKHLPAIIYPERKGVLPYLGVRHISGIKKWEAYSKASYIAYMIEEGLSIDEIQRQIGDRSNSVKKIYFSYRLIEVVEDGFDVNTERAKDFFSYLILALGQSSVKSYLGIPKGWNRVNFEDPVSEDKLENLKNLFSWLFGEGKAKLPVVKESRDITSKLSPVLGSDDAILHLKHTRDLQYAYERSDGERDLLLKNLKGATRNLQNSLGLISEYKEDELALNEATKCERVLKDILKFAASTYDQTYFPPESEPNGLSKTIN